MSNSFLLFICILFLSCCGLSKATCFDNDLCTYDLENMLGTCYFGQIDCNDHNACTFDDCPGPSIGCKNTPISCDDGDIYTYDTCDTLTGCSHHPMYCSVIASCDGTTVNDNDECTIDICANSTLACHYQPGCDDSNACTIDSCSATSGCSHTNVTCTPDADLCTNTICDPVSGCKHVPINCDDGNYCTTDTCSGGVCSHTTITCNDGKSSTIDKCYPSVGCVFRNSSSSCTDNSVCTKDTKLANGTCSYSLVSNYNLGNKCKNQDPVCDPVNGWTYTLVNCDDGNACTTDTCDSSIGCIHTQRSCEDGQRCTKDSCDVATGQCVHSPISTLIDPTC